MGEAPVNVCDCGHYQHPHCAAPPYHFCFCGGTSCNPWQGLLAYALVYHLQSLVQWDVPIPCVDSTLSVAIFPCRLAVLAPQTPSRSASSVSACRSCSSYRGGEIRTSLESGAISGNSPLASFRSESWLWQCFLSFAEHGQHFNVLELQTGFAALRWRTRRFPQNWSICLYPLVTLLCIACSTKGRTSSRLLYGFLRRIGVLSLASVCCLFFADSRECTECCGCGNRIRIDRLSKCDAVYCEH